MERKPNFERLRKALMLEGEPDRVPLGELWVDYDVKVAFLGKPVLDIQTEIEFWEKAGYDYVHLVPGYEFPKRRVIGKAKYSAYQEIEQERSWVQSQSGMIEDWEDFEKYPWPDLDQVDYSPLEEAQKYLPEGMKLITGTLAGVFEESSWLLGFDNLCLGLMGEPELVEAVFHKVGKIEYEIFKNAAEFDNVGAMWHSDDIAYYSSTILSPKHLRKLVFPWYKKMGEVCQKKDLPFLYHSDGNLWEIIPDLIDAGYNALQPVEPKAMDIRELKDKVGDRLSFLGNIDLGYTLTRGKPEEVVAEVKQRIREIAPGGGYCVGSSNSVTNYVSLENYKAMLEATLKYGQYPIS